MSETMNRTSDGVAEPTYRRETRRSLALLALVIGPPLVALSALFNHQPDSQSAAELLAVTVAHRNAQLAEIGLELIGLVLLFVGCIGVAGQVRTRGRGLATAGIVLGFAGIVGFTMVNAEGLVMNALAGMSDGAAAVAAADAINHSPAVYAAFPLILLGEIGVVLVVGAFRRASVVPVWPVVLAALSVVVDFAGSSKAMLLASDVLVLAAAWWLAVALSRRER